MQSASLRMRVSMRMHSCSCFCGKMPLAVGFSDAFRKTSPGERKTHLQRMTNYNSPEGTVISGTKAWQRPSCYSEHPERRHRSLLSSDGKSGPRG